MDHNKLQSILYRHLIAARDLDTATANDLVRLLNAGDAELVEKIAGQYARIEKNNGVDRSPVKTKRFEDMLTAIREVNAKAYKPYAAGVRKEVLDRATHEAEIAAKAWREAGGATEIGAVIPSTEFLKSLVENTPIPINNNGVALLKPWLDGMEKSRFDRLEQAIRLGVLQGETADDLVKRIAGTKAANYTDGILQISRQSAQTLAITANAAVQNDARLATYRNMKSVRFVEWSSILDTRTSPICQMRSGDIYPIDKPHPKPPAHPRCRSVLLPRRDADGAKHKPIPEWLRGESEDVQNEVLDGKARGDLFRANPDFDFKGYFRDNGSFKSLAELRQFDEGLFTGGVKSPPRAAPKAPATPTPAPAPAPKGFVSPYAGAPMEADIKVQPKARVKAQLGERMAKAALDPRLSPRPEFKGIKAEGFGKASLPGELSDEAASMVGAIMPELDALTDAFGVPRIRGIRIVTSKAVADMGDQTLGLSPSYFNHWARKIAPVELTDAEIGKARADMLAIRERMRAARDRKTYNKLSKEFDVLYRKVNAREDSPVSTWKIGSTEKRPNNAFHYFADGVDRARQTLYHETAHAIHQMYKRTQLRRFATPPLEARLRALYVSLRGRFAEFPSDYATTNQFEFFAESFSLYMMGRKDLVMKEMVDLIEELLNEQAV